MINVFISFNPKDEGFTSKLKSALNFYNIDIIPFDIKIENGKNISQIISEKLKISKLIILTFSRHYISDSSELNTIRAILSKEIEDVNPLIVPILIGDCKIPKDLQSLKFIDFTKKWSKPLSELIDSIKNREDVPSNFEIFENDTKKKKLLLESHIEILQEHYRKGNLSIFCGAGISIDAGLPSWPEMLKNLLIKLFERRQRDEHIDKSEILLADFYKEYFNHSPLMLAQYLKNGFGKDFIENVRHELYSCEIKESELINSIVELCRPNRFFRCLNSIVTFNFDDLIEEKLKENKIKFKSISNEGERAAIEQVPIFHVHGFIPRKENIPEDINIVFSEDAYHSQFMDSFSWSNLVQLITLNQNLCLFIGLSLTDPNLRRILDVSMRKNPTRELKHFFFKKRFDKSEIENKVMKLTQACKGMDPNRFIDFIESLEEIDANKLGLNVIWIDNYEKILKILKRVVD